MNTAPTWLTVADLARELGLCTKTVRKFLDDGTIPVGCRFGGVWRISPDEWAAFRARASTLVKTHENNVTPMDLVRTRRLAS